MTLILFIILMIFTLCKNSIYYVFGFISWTDFLKNNIKFVGQQNIIFLKLLQWLYIKNDSTFFTQEITDYINSFTNNTPYADEDIDYDLINNILQHSIKNNNILIFNSLVPINSGSISLVFKGSLNNKPIAIKILRKNIYQKILNGIKLINDVIYFLELFRIGKNFHINEVFGGSNEILEQLNFDQEITNVQIFKNKFKKNKFIAIPDIYPEYTLDLKNVIVMEWLDGININTLSENDKLNICPLYLKYIYSSYAMKGIIHGDLHQGNILFIKDNSDVWKIGLLDFGTIYEAQIDEINFITIFINVLLNNNNISELMDFISENQNDIFISYTDTNTQICIKKCYELNKNKLLFTSNITLSEQIITFLNLLKNNNCIIKKQLYKIINTLIPQLYIYKNLNLSKQHINLLANNLNKINNKFAI